MEVPVELRGMGAPLIDRDGRFLLVPLGDGQRLLLLQRDRRSGVLAYEGVRVFRTAEERAEYMERLGATR